MERGALGFVLRLSRVMGIAPYPRGSQVQVLKALVIYGFVLVTFLSFYILSITYIILMKNKSPLLARAIIRAVSNSVSVTLVLFRAYTAQGRMRHMARSLKQLEQIFGGLVSFLVIILTYVPEAKRPAQIHMNTFYFTNAENN